MKRSKAQLNAISRSITLRNQVEAVEGLKALGIDFESYKIQHGWKGSPIVLLRLVKAGKR